MVLYIKLLQSYLHDTIKVSRLVDNQLPIAILRALNYKIKQNSSHKKTKFTELFSQCH